MNITRSNYEEYMIDYLEGTLSAEDSAKVEAFLENNPDLAAELAGLEEMVLVPNEEILYEHKESLKKHPPKSKIIQLNWRLWSGAITIAAALALFFFIQNPDQEGTAPTVATSTTPNKVETVAADKGTQEELNKSNNIESVDEENAAQEEEVKFQEVKETPQQKTKKQTQPIIHKNSMFSLPLFSQKKAKKENTKPNTNSKIEQATQLPTFAQKGAPNANTPKTNDNPSTNPNDNPITNSKLNNNPSTKPVQNPIANNDQPKQNDNLQNQIERAVQPKPVIEKENTVVEDTQLASNEPKAKKPLTAKQKRQLKRAKKKNKYSPGELLWKKVQDAVVPEALAYNLSPGPDDVSVEINTPSPQKVLKNITKNILP